MYRIGIKVLEDNLLTQNTGSASETGIASVQDDQTQTIERKKAELLKQETEITQGQLSISKRLLNWRTIVPLIIAIIALVIFAQKININPKLTLAAMRNANIYFILAAFIVFHFQYVQFAGKFCWKMLVILKRMAFIYQNFGNYSRSSMFPGLLM